MKEILEERVLNVANYIIRTHSTIRTTSKEFGVSKSTIHKDLKDRLSEINPILYLEAENVLELNKAERHIRGGLATKLKLKNTKKQKEVWKDIFDYEGFYQVSNLGNIKSLDRYVIGKNGSKRFIYAKKMKLKIMKKDGSVAINLSKDGIKKMQYLSRIVYKAFNPSFDYYDSDIFIAHKDNNPQNNALDNLYIYSSNRECFKRKVICITTNKKFDSIVEAGDFYNICSSHITKCCQKKISYTGTLSDGTKLVWEYYND